MLFAQGAEAQQQPGLNSSPSNQANRYQKPQDSASLAPKIERIKSKLRSMKQQGGVDPAVAQLMRELQLAGKRGDAEAMERIADDLLAKLEGVTSSDTADALFAAGSSSPTSVSLPAGVSPTNYTVVFPLRDETGNQQLVAMDIDGSNRRQLTTGGNSGQPSWSPDGTHLVYTFMDVWNGETSLWVMDGDGSNKRRLVRGRAPDWSATNKIIYSDHPDGGGPFQLFTISADGSGRRQITQVEAGVLANVHASWSPDGKQIVFVKIRRQNPSEDDTSNGCRAAGFQPELWVSDADGGNAYKLVPSGLYNRNRDGSIINSAFDANAPDWSPVSNDIVYWSGQEGCWGHIWKIDADGRNPVQLTHDVALSNNDSPTWSVDGSLISFTTQRRGSPEMWIMSASGQQLQPLHVHSPRPFPADAAWRPRGNGRQ